MNQVGYTTSRAESIAQFLTVFLLFLLVLGLTYFATRFVGSVQKNTMMNRNFEVIESFRITNGKYLQLVRIGQKYYTIGISKDNITTICEVSPEEIRYDTAKPQGMDSFKNILDKAKEHIGKGGNNEK